MKAILFDLDGTLLQMDNDEFLKRFEEVMVPYFISLGYDGNEFSRAYSSTFYKMIKNDGSKTNEEVFFKALLEVYKDKEKLNSDLNLFYENALDEVCTILKRDQYPRLLIDLLKERGYKLILATNPLFPKEFTYKRIRWAGLEPDDFSYISTYDNSSYSKPSREYYLDLISKNRLMDDELIMIGNDIDDDFSNLPKGIGRILITDFLINRKNAPLDMKHLSLKDLYYEVLENRI